jgi:cobalamin biosynthesis protein CobD/CbiB
MKYLLFGSGAAFLGILPLPIDAYHLIRWIVAGTAALGCYEIFKSKTEDKNTRVLLGIIALVYNPIFPFYFNRSIWIFFDVIAGACLIYVSLNFKSQAKTDNQFQSEQVKEAIEEKIKQVEKKSDNFIKQTLISSIALLIFIFIISFVMKK